MKDDLVSLILGLIMKETNKFLFPDVLCPWGESEYLHQCGYVDFDGIIQPFIPTIFLKMMGSHKTVMPLICSARDEFIRDPNEYHTLLLNPNWRIVSTIVFSANKGPVVCTSRLMNGGCKKDFLHLSRQPDHVLPCTISNQLCHSVIRPIMIKPMKSHQYSNSYQMHEQKGSFQGIDTCDVTDFGNFSFTYILLDQAESWSIAYQPDINSLLDKLTTYNILTLQAAQDKRDCASSLYPDKSIEEKYVFGSTYISLEDAVAIQRYQGSHHQVLLVIWDDICDIEQVAEVYCRCNWPPCI